MRFAVQWRLLRTYGPAVEEPVSALMATYVTTSEEHGVDPLIPVCQLLLETEFLTSSSHRLRVDEQRLQFPTREPMGPWLALWVEVVLAHTALLLAHALPVGQESAHQFKLLSSKANRPPFPDGLRGSAPTLDLFARAWTAETGYLDRLCEIGNSILSPQY
jgi:hypothetical protein